MAAFPQKKNILVHNVNSSAKELIHDLNKTRDSIKLECLDADIVRVGLYKSADDKGEAYSKYFYPRSRKASIPLENLPKGRYAVSVYVKRKIIMITMLVVEDMFIKTVGVNKLNVEDVFPPPKLNLTPTLYEIKRDSAAPVAQFSLNKPVVNNKVESNVAPIIKRLPTYEKPPEPIVKKQEPVYYEQTADTLIPLIQRSSLFSDPVISGYWVIEMVVDRFGSNSFEGFVDEETAKSMIAKNRYDITTYTGKYNKLVVWKVHDKKVFLEQQKVIDGVVYYPSGSFDEAPIYITKQ